MTIIKKNIAEAKCCSANTFLAGLEIRPESRNINILERKRALLGNMICLFEYVYQNMNYISIM